jgi:predicted nucleic acid-binding protein
LRIYAESSAILAWVLGDVAGEVARSHLTSAESVFTSALTLVECERALIRARTLEDIPEAELADRRRILAKASTHWHRLPLRDEILERAKRPFPVEPVRTLDAIHLASALVARSAVPDVALLTLDRRIRDAGLGLGFEVVPPGTGT